MFGRHAWVVDPKGEYGPLAAACGVTPIRVAPGSPLRLNPLDAGPGYTQLGAEAVTRRRVGLLTSLAAASLGRPLTPEEQTACEIALRAAEAARPESVTLPDVVDALLWPTDTAADDIAWDVRDLAAASRHVALELRRLCRGDLAGLFDGPTSPGIDLDAPLVVLDLSAVYGSDAMGLLMLCAAAWLQASLTARRDKLIFVVDEAWAILRDVAIGRWLQASWKLSRQFGVSNIAVVHRLSDLQAGAEGSEQARLAEGLLADSETRVIYGQAPGEVAAARHLLDLTDVEADVLPDLGRGVALWRVGPRPFLVQHTLGAHERAIVDTDTRMA